MTESRHELWDGAGGTPPARSVPSPPPNASQLEAAFHALRDLAPAARATELERICASDHALRKHLETLLAGHDDPGFLKAPVLPPGTLERLIDRGDDMSGRTIDRYHLLRHIGAGGMGEVYLAEQREPVQRRVALKLLRSGVPSDSIHRRFEVERRVLARLDHPSIAKILDAGTAQDGRPYFAMELVDGLPITEHCDEGRSPSTSGSSCSGACARPSTTRISGGSCTAT